MGDTPHFTRDPTLAADVADQFGGGAGNAEALVEANALRFSPELTDAQLRPGESGKLAEDRRDLDLSKGDVAKAADLDEDTIEAWEVHGDYLVFAFTGSDDRTHKDVLLINDDGKLDAPEGHSSPQRAAIRAQAAATSKVKEARADADEIIAKAQAEADRILAEASEKAQEEKAEAVQEAQEQAVKDAEGDSKPKKAAAKK